MKRYPSIPNVFELDRSTGKYDTDRWAKPEFEELRNIDWIATEKIDGTNIRVIWDGETVQVRGRSDAAQVPKSLHATLLQQLKPQFVRDKLSQVFTNATFTLESPLCIYGEGYGAGIQKGGDYAPDQRFAAFDVRLGQEWLGQDLALEVTNALELERMPFLAIVDLYEAVECIKEGEPSVLRVGLVEGVVVRPKLELRDCYGHRIIGKIKTKYFKRG